MARWKVKADANAESAGGGGQKFPAAPRGFYNIQVADYTDGETKESNRPKVDLMCEIADGPYMGTRVYLTVTMIPEGEKGHGLMVHALHAFGLAHDGNLDFDTSDFQGKTAKALLGVEMRTKVKDGRSYENEVNIVEALYTEKHPQPDELPAAPKPKEKPAQAGKPQVSAAVQGVFGKGAKAKPPVDEEVPF